ncbi:MAG: hypothetical protein AAFU80_25380 [Pseudomonadota bacterium]
MLIPSTRYHDPNAALALPTGVPGLAEHLVVWYEPGHVPVAQLALGTGIIVLGPEDEETDVAFTCRDPEGHALSLGADEPLAAGNVDGLGNGAAGG